MTGVITIFYSGLLELSKSFLDPVSTLHPAPCTLHPVPCTLHPVAHGCQMRALALAPQALLTQPQLSRLPRCRPYSRPPVGSLVST